MPNAERIPLLPYPPCCVNCKKWDSELGISGKCTNTESLKLDTTTSNGDTCEKFSGLVVLK